MVNRIVPKGLLDVVLGFLISPRFCGECQQGVMDLRCYAVTSR